MANVRSIAGRSIHWRSGRVVHACEGAELVPGAFVLWTLCGMDVASGSAQLAHARERVTCRACARLATAPPANDEAPRLSPEMPIDATQANREGNFVSLLLRQLKKDRPAWPGTTQSRASDHSARRPRS
jgi:hypothetical protein